MRTDDLKAFGVIPLTGESCALSQRMLCDLTEEGAKLMEDFLGSNVTIHRGSNWNSSSNQVASIKLPWSMIFEFYIYAKWRTSERNWLFIDYDSRTLMEADEYMEFPGAVSKQTQRGSTSNHPVDEKGNHIHAMTGRAV